MSRLTLITLGYRLDNISLVSKSIATAIDQYKLYRNVDKLQLELTWVISIDSVNSFGKLVISSELLKLANSNELSVKLTRHTPHQPYDPIGINEVIQAQYELNKDDKEYFMLLDDDNRVIWNLFYYFELLQELDRDVIVFNMLNSNGKLLSYHRDKFDITDTSLDPSRTCFSYRIYKELGPIENKDYPESQVMIDKGMMTPWMPRIYDLTWYCRLNIPDRIISPDDIENQKFSIRPQVTHNYFHVNRDFDLDSMNLVILTAYDGQSSITRIIDPSQFELIKYLIKCN